MLDSLKLHASQLVGQIKAKLNWLHKYESLHKNSKLHPTSHHFDFEGTANVRLGLWGKYKLFINYHLCKKNAYN